MRNIGEMVTIDSYENILSKSEKIFDGDCIEFHDNTIDFISAMKVYCGQDLEISHIGERITPSGKLIPLYRMKGNIYTWSDEMLVQQIQKNKFDFSELIIEI